MNDASKSQTESSPLISVIIPAYNVEEYLAAAIESVLQQNDASLQIVIIDDGSTDDTGRVAQSFGQQVTYFQQENSGIGAARNAGLQNARGDFVAFLDADDLWPQGRLERLLKELESEPMLDMVFGQMEHFFSPDLSEADRERLHCPSERIAAMHAGGFLAKRTAVERVGPFITDKRIGEFIDWYMRAQEAGLRMKTIPDLVLRRRIHGSNTVLRESVSQKEYAAILHQAILRRRLAARTASEAK
ncbi:MAG: glycosyltransferase family 2 protein [Caldilineales bacterium]|nr:glycosyltransferase family 2 protein [Caldilineales bacterium]